MWLGIFFGIVLLCVVIAFAVFSLAVAIALFLDSIHDNDIEE